MSNYRRYFVPGGCWFFTVTLADRRGSLLVDRIADLRSAVSTVRAAHPFEVDAIVVLPDHIHAIWRLPDGDTDFPLRWRLIKRAFSIAIGDAAPPAVGLRPRERGVWQRRYWEHLIRDDEDYSRHVDYCHINPMKHRLVN